MNFYVETSRLHMRTFQEKDIKPFATYRSIPEVAQYQGWQAPYSLAQATQFVAHMKATLPNQPGVWYQVALEHKSDGVLIGDCAYRLMADDERQAEIGFTLAPAYQRRGYATEAVMYLFTYLFEEQNLHRIYAYCDVENLASARLMEKVGMRREGHFVDSAWFKGYWSSEYLYALLQREWLQQR